MLLRSVILSVMTDKEKSVLNLTSVSLSIDVTFKNDTAYVNIYRLLLKVFVACVVYHHSVVVFARHL